MFFPLPLRRLEGEKLRCEAFMKVLPAFKILLIELRRFESEFGWPANEARLEHERQRVGEIRGLQIGRDGLLIGDGIRSVARHAIVQAGASGNKPFGLGVVFSTYQAHEFAHKVAVEPWRAERVFGHQPTRRENAKINLRCAGNFRWRCQYRVNRRIRMIEAYRVDAIEALEIVFIRRIVSMPGHHVQWRMVDLCGPQMTLKFRDQAKITGAIFICGMRASGNHEDWPVRWRRSGPGPAIGKARHNSRKCSLAPACRVIRRGI